MITVRPAEARGHAKHGWLDSHHTFSFASYYDAEHMGVSSLRVINDDRVIPGAGFATHSHQDMEIISYVVKGAIEHKDSMGNIQTLPAGEFQLMSAGTGVTHSEYNPSQDDELNFLQIWIEPNAYGVEPGYQQKRFPAGDMQLVVSADGRDGSLSVHQDAELYHVNLGEGKRASLDNVSGRTLYLHVIHGRIQVEGKTLGPGDGATLTELSSVSLTADSDSEALLFNLA